MPLAAESCSRYGKEAARFLNDFGDVVVADSCVSKAAFVRIVCKEPRSALCWGNTRMYDRSLIMAACGMGRAFMLRSGRA